jgi:hypothetical protein
VPEIQENPQYPMLLPEMVRTAVAAGAPELAGELVSLARPVYAGHEHAVQAARAVLAEGRGDLEEAASLYADSAKRWAEFGNVVEEAFALVGLGRCALLLGRRAEASEPLVQARKLFADMGASPHVEEADILLAQATALTS